MPAQGHHINGSSDFNLKLDNGREFAIKRLMTLQHKPVDEEATEFVDINCITYYFFVGHDQVTNDHLKRTIIDMKDRLLRGMDQRWAYVSASMWYGKVPHIQQEIPMEEADRKLRDFLSGFVEKQVNWDQITR